MHCHQAAKETPLSHGFHCIMQNTHQSMNRYHVYGPRRVNICTDALLNIVFQRISHGASIEPEKETPLSTGTVDERINLILHMVC